MFDLYVPPRGKKVLRTVCSFAKRYGAWPSVQEVANRAGVAHTTAHRDLTALRAKGYVDVWRTGKDSGWYILPAGFALLGCEPFICDSTRVASRRIRNDGKGAYAAFQRERKTAKRFMAATYDLLQVMEA